MIHIKEQKIGNWNTWTKEWGRSDLCSFFVLHVFKGGREIVAFSFHSFLIWSTLQLWDVEVPVVPSSPACDYGEWELSKPCVAVLGLRLFSSGWGVSSRATESSAWFIWKRSRTDRLMLSKGETKARKNRDKGSVIGGLVARDEISTMFWLEALRRRSSDVEGVWDVPTWFQRNAVFGFLGGGEEEGIWRHLSSLLRSKHVFVTYWRVCSGSVYWA